MCPVTTKQPRRPKGSTNYGGPPPPRSHRGRPSCHRAGAANKTARLYTGGLNTQCRLRRRKGRTTFGTLPRADKGGTGLILSAASGGEGGHLYVPLWRTSRRKVPVCPTVAHSAAQKVASALVNYVYKKPGRTCKNLPKPEKTCKM